MTVAPSLETCADYNDVAQDIPLPSRFSCSVHEMHYGEDASVRTYVSSPKTMNDLISLK